MPLQRRVRSARTARSTNTYRKASETIGFATARTSRLNDSARWVSELVDTKLKSKFDGCISRNASLRAFRDLDVDGDGRVSAADVQASVQQYGAPCTLEEAEAFIGRTRALGQERLARPESNAKDESGGDKGTPPNGAASVPALAATVPSLTLTEFSRAFGGVEEASYSRRSERNLGWFGASTRRCLEKYGGKAIEGTDAIDECAADGSNVKATDLVSSSRSLGGDLPRSSRYDRPLSTRDISSIIAERVREEFGCRSDRLENFYSGLHVPVKFEYVPSVDTKHLIVPSERCQYYASDRTRFKGSMYSLGDFAVKGLPSDVDKQARQLQNQRRLEAVRESHRRFDELIGRKEASNKHAETDRLMLKRNMLMDYHRRVGSRFCHVSSS